MCEAYEAEYRGIVNSENRATIKGFFARLDKKPITENPFHEKWEGYEHKAWDHGWRCADGGPYAGNERLLPWAIEGKIPYEKRQELARKFKETGRFPIAWRRKLGS